MKGLPVHYHSPALAACRASGGGASAGWVDASFQQVKPFTTWGDVPSGCPQSKVQFHRFPGEAQARPAYQYIYPDGTLGGWYDVQTVVAPGVTVPAGTEICHSFIGAGTIFSGMKNILANVQIKAPTRIRQCEIYGGELRGGVVANSIIINAGRLEQVDLDGIVIDGAARLVNVKARGGQGYGGTPCFLTGTELMGEASGSILITGDTDATGVRFRGSLSAASSHELARALVGRGKGSSATPASDPNPGRSSVVSRDGINPSDLYRRRRN